MAQQPKGSRKRRGVSFKTACQMLSVNRETLHAWVRNKRVVPTDGTSSKDWVFDHDQLLSVFRGATKKIDPAEAVERALRAEHLSTALMERVGSLERLLGLDVPALKATPEEVLALVREAQSLLEKEEKTVFQEEVVFTWARRFLAMTEAYLTQVAVITGDTTSWAVFTRLGHRLSLHLTETAPNRYTRDLLQGYLEAGRRNLRQAAYYNARDEYGADVATKLFPEGRKNLDEAVIGFLFPRG